MRRSIVAAAMTLLCVTAAWGAEIPQSVTDAVPPEAAGLLQVVGNTADHETLWAGLSGAISASTTFILFALFRSLYGGLGSASPPAVQAYVAARTDAEERTQASTNATPATPSSMVGNTTSGGIAAPDRRARIARAASA